MTSLPFFLFCFFKLCQQFNFMFRGFIKVPITPQNVFRFVKSLYGIAKRASDVMTQTRLRQTNRNGGRFS